MALQYTIFLEPNPDERMYTVSVPVLPGCVTQSATLEECIERAREAIAAWIADARGRRTDPRGDLVPKERMLCCRRVGRRSSSPPSKCAG